MIEKSQKLEDEMCSGARNKLATFNHVKKSLEHRMEDIHLRVMELKKEVQSNLKSAENPSGVLNGELDAYLSCFIVHSDKAHDLLLKDEALCKENLAQAQHKVAGVKEKF